MHFAPLRIRKLGPADEPMLLDYLEDHASNNIFLLADLAQYGWEHPQLRYYGALRGAHGGCLDAFPVLGPPLLA